MPSRIRAILEATDKASPTFSKVGGAIKALGGIAATVGAVQIGRQLVGAIATATDLAGKQEVQERKLQAALLSTGQFSRQLFNELKAQAGALQNLTDVGDETILQIQGLLLQFGVGPKVVTEMSESVLDLAKTFKIDFLSAATLTAKAVSGNVGALSRYGVQIKRADVESRGAVAVLEKLQERFGGRAQAEANTFAGSVTQVSNAWGDLQEKIGGPIIEVLQRLNRLVILPLIQTLDATIVETLSFRNSLLDVSIAALRVAETIEPTIRKLAAVGVVLGRVAINKFEADLNRMNFALIAMGFSAGEGESKLRELRLELEKLRREGPAAVDETKNRFQQLPPAVSEFDELLKKLGVTIDEELISKAADVQRAYTLALQGLTNGEISTERFDVINESLTRIARTIQEKGGIVDGFAQVKEIVQLDLSEALRVFSDEGVGALLAKLNDGGVKVESLTTTLATGFRQLAIPAVSEFGSLLVDAAFGADVSFKQFAENALKSLAQMLVQALLLRAVLGAIPGFGAANTAAAEGGGSFFSTIFGGLTGLFGQSGLVVPGRSRGQDSVLIAAEPGEVLLSRNQVQQLLDGSTGGQPKVEVFVGGSLEGLVDNINVRIVDGSLRLKSSELVTGRDGR